MICTAAIVVAIHPPPARALLSPPAHRQTVCLPKRYAKALRAGRFVVVVDGKPVAVSKGTVSR